MRIYSNIGPEVAGISVSVQPLDMAYVAQGRFDGFWETGLSDWDTAAGCHLSVKQGDLSAILEDVLSLFTQKKFWLQMTLCILNYIR